MGHKNRSKWKFLYNFMNKNNNLNTIVKNVYSFQ